MISINYKYMIPYNCIQTNDYYRHIKKKIQFKKGFKWNIENIVMILIKHLQMN